MTHFWLAYLALTFALALYLAIRIAIEIEQRNHAAYEFARDYYRKPVNVVNLDVYRPNPSPQLVFAENGAPIKRH